MSSSKSGVAAQVARLWHRIGRLAGAAYAWIFMLSVSGVAFAQGSDPGGSGNKHFTAAPVPKPDKPADAPMDSILGVDINTIFLVAVGVFALYWFTLGGGRRARIDKFNRQKN